MDISVENDYLPLPKLIISSRDRLEFKEHIAQSLIVVLNSVDHDHLFRWHDEHRS